MKTIMCDGCDQKIDPVNSGANDFGAVEVVASTQNRSSLITYDLCLLCHGIWLGLANPLNWPRSNEANVNVHAAWNIIKARR